MKSAKLHPVPAARFCVTVTLLFFVAVFEIGAEECVDLAAPDAAVFAGNVLEYREKKQPLLAAAILSGELKGFVRVPDPFASFGYTAENFILRFPVCAAPSVGKIFVQVQGLFPHALALYVPAACRSGTPCAVENGKRIGRDRNALFVFDTVREAGHIYLDATPPGSRRYPVFAARAERFLDSEKRYLWSAGLFFGALATILIYNLAIYFGLKEKINLYYSAYLVLFIGVFLTLERIPEMMAGHSDAPVYLFFRSALFPAMLIPFALFNRDFLGAAAGRHQVLIWRLLIAADILAVAMNFMVEYRRMMPVNLIITVIHCVVALFFVIKAMLGGFQPAWIMFFGWVFFMVSAILSSFHILGLFAISYNDYLAHMMKFGSVAENLLFTVALSVRVRFYKKQAGQFSAQLAVEREVLARDLHDVLGSEFGQIQMKLARADVPGDIALWLGQKSGSMSSRIRDIIFLLRSDLTAATIRDELEAYLEILRGMDNFTLTTAVDFDAAQTNAFLLLDALRILQEWSGNCMRHGAPSRMVIRIEKRHYGLRMAILSDGKVFRWSGERLGEGQGLAGIQARARQRSGFARCRPTPSGNLFVAVLRRFDNERRYVGQK